MADLFDGLADVLRGTPLFMDVSYTVKGGVAVIVKGRLLDQVTTLVGKRRVEFAHVYAFSDDVADPDAGDIFTIDGVAWRVCEIDGVIREKEGGPVWKINVESDVRGIL